MSSLNKIMLIGNVGNDPEIKAFDNGNEVANFSIATSEKWKDKTTGEQKEKTYWHNIAVFGGLVNVVKNYVKKGTKLYVEGASQTRKWQDNEGNDRYTTEVVLNGFNSNLILLSNKDSVDTVKQDSQPTQENTVDDEIPF
jgi:single-strand DNA-binding protein